MTTCPHCDKRGKAVDTATVKSLLAISLSYIQEGAYYFCETAACDVVYFNEDGRQAFLKHQIRERVYQKEPDADDVLVCYCFMHTLGDIRRQTAQSEDVTIVDDINDGILAGQCACDWRNPQGRCCLGNVRRLMLQQSQTAS